MVDNEKILRQVLNKMIVKENKWLKISLVCVLNYSLCVVYECNLLYPFNIDRLKEDLKFQTVSLVNMIGIKNPSGTDMAVAVEFVIKNIK